MPSTLLPNRIRRKPVTVSSAHAQLVRQWQLLEWLSSEPDGVTVKEAADATGVNEKTIRRDLIILRQIGFDLEETVEERGRKRWRVRQPFERLRSKRRQYEAIRDGLDVLMGQAAQVGDERLAHDLRAIRRRVARKAK
jgi:predicted DNA-binding transcriptional regulator YafY